MNVRCAQYLKVGLLALVCSMQTNVAFAVNEDNVALLEAAGNIKLTSQGLAKAYFYKYQGIRVDNANRDLEVGLITLNNAIKKMEAQLVGDEEKNILMFVTFTRDEIEGVLTAPPSEDNAALMMDYSESLLEGAEFIAETHPLGEEEGESMLVIAERMSFLLERINKYYIAFRAGFDDHNNVIQLNQAVEKFEEDMGQVNSYANYPAPVQASAKKLNRFWPIAKRFYLGIEKSALPVIVMASTSNLGSVLKKLEQHHRELVLRDESM